MEDDDKYKLRIKRRYEKVCDKLDVLNAEAFELEQDKDLKKIGNNYDDDFHWENNNTKFEALYILLSCAMFWAIFVLFILHLAKII